VPGLPKPDFPWTDTGELNARDLDRHGIRNLHARGQYKFKNCSFDRWREDQRISPAIGSSSLMLPNLSNLENVVYSKRDNNYNTKLSTVPRYSAYQEHL